jgi:hypothetical protein
MYLKLESLGGETGPGPFVGPSGCIPGSLFISIQSGNTEHAYVRLCDPHKPRASSIVKKSYTSWGILRLRYGTHWHTPASMWTSPSRGVKQSIVFSRRLISKSKSSPPLITSENIRRIRYSMGFACYLKNKGFQTSNLKNQEYQTSNLKNQAYQTGNLKLYCFLLVSCIFVLCFDPKGGGTEYFRNVGKHLPNSTASHPKTYNFFTTGEPCRAKCRAASVPI